MNKKTKTTKTKYCDSSFSYTGFTLIELLIVIAIIGLLSSVVLASLNSARKKARDTRRISDFKQISLTLEMFYDKTGFYPITASAGPWAGHWKNFSNCLETGIACDLENASFTTTPTISKVPEDPLFNGDYTDAGAVTYFYGWPSGCYAGFPSGTQRGQAYRLGVKLEIIDSATLNNDLDGSLYNNDTRCNDGGPLGYCVGVGSCAGW